MTTLVDVYYSGPAEHMELGRNCPQLLLADAWTPFHSDYFIHMSLSRLDLNIFRRACSIGMVARWNGEISYSILQLNEGSWPTKEF
jgi:hypothetical protein